LRSCAHAWRSRAARVRAAVVCTGPAMHFIDEAQIYVKAGDGGNGCVAFRREAHVPRGGPSGGDGGNGGDVVLVTDPQLSTLLDFKYKRHYDAERGEDGRGKDQYGRAGEDLELRVPVGTVVTDVDTGELVADLSEPGTRVVLCAGGRGGRGNMHFATPWNQAPRTAEPGTPGEERTVRLELKLLADVGLLGYPSVGKSTLISRISRARPKIADYPFTTLVPNLGVVRLSDERTLVVADIPGLIEGAAEGAGLGHRFLRHVERTRVLVHLLEAHDMTGPDREPLRDFDVINAELAQYAPELADKPQIVVLNKLDLPATREAAPELAARLAERGIALHAISAVTGEGLGELLELLWQHVHAPAPASE
jgi:GTPase